MFDTARKKLTAHFGKYLLSWFTRDDADSDAPVTVMMPLAPKDAARARHAIPKIRANLAHPIERFLVVGPNRDDLPVLCAEMGVEFVDEMGPLAELLGADCATTLEGWYKQQFLKLISPAVADADRVLTIDSDTYPQRRTRFLDDAGRVLLYWAEQDPTDYHKFTELMIGPCPGARTSYIAHCMLFERRHLDALTVEIEARHAKPWPVAMLETLRQGYQQAGQLSEFDLYGHFLRRDRPGKSRVRYYSNQKVSPAEFSGETRLDWWKRRFRFLSNHQHGE